MENLKFDPASLKSHADTPSTSKANPVTVSRGVQALFSAYRANDFADAEGFFVQAASVLSEFPEEIVVHVTSPRTGMQRRSKWPPTISEILDACEQYQDYLRKVRAPRRPTIAQRLPSPALRNRPQGSLANLFVPEGHPRYARLVEWTETADPVFWKFGNSSDGRPGLWIPLNVWQEGLPVQAKPQQPAPRDLTLTPEARLAMAQRIEPESETDAA